MLKISVSFDFIFEKMHIHWKTKGASYNSISNQLKEEYNLRKRLISRLLPFADESDEQNVLEGLELCFNEKNQSFGICNITSKASQFLFKHLSSEELNNEFNIYGVCTA